MNSFSQLKTKKKRNDLLISEQTLNRFGRMNFSVCNDKIYAIIIYIILPLLRRRPSPSQGRKIL